MKRLTTVLLLAGCASTGRFGELSQAEQSTFQRCMKPIEPAIGCTGMADVAELVCIGNSQKAYADQPTPLARKEWLVANGCPPAMVQPARFLSDEGAAK